MSEPWKGRCILLSETDERDALSRPQKKLVEEKTVFCRQLDVGQGEFYQAAAQGYKVELQLEVRKSVMMPRITHVKYKGKPYRILRVRGAKSSENVVLVCIDKHNEASDG